MKLNEEQIERYSRHIILKDVGGVGQKKILTSKILIVGAGGLGSPAALYLAAAGVGTIGIIDSDRVDLSNLQRQIIHFTKDVDVEKVDSAEEKIRSINPDVRVVKYSERLTAANIESIIADYDFVIEGSDNFPTKFLVNDACVFFKKPYSHGGILRFRGQTLTYVPGFLCYRCIFEEPPPPGAVPSCREAGVLGPVAGILGTIQATEALKFILGKGDLLVNRLLTFDAATMEFRTVQIKRNRRCPVCGDNPKITKLIDYEQAVCDLDSLPKERPVKIPLKIKKEIIEQAEIESPLEACGYLAGRDNEIVRRFPMTNVDKSPEHFSFDIKEQFKVAKEVRNSGLELIGVYHSHPETPARLSEEDKRLAVDPEITYVIVSLLDSTFKAFCLKGQEVCEVSIEWI